MRQLKWHEQKLLKKVDFLQWKTDAGVRENTMLRRYRIENRGDYVKYVSTACHILCPHTSTSQGASNNLGKM